MTDFRGVVSKQVDVLLRALRTQQDYRCRHLIGDAEKQRKELLRTCRRELRERVHQAVEEERKRRETALHETRHRIQTAERRDRQARYDELLQRAWPKLLAELERRWSDAASRRAWCDMLLHEAAQYLPAESWRIEHPELWSDEDTRWLTHAVRDRGLAPPSLHADPEGRMGLKIRHGTACLDGTLDGLLARRVSVQASLLGAWERELLKASRHPHG